MSMRAVGVPAAGSSGITALTGDVSASGPGSAAATIATVTVAKGGTGRTTLTANNVLLGNTTTAVQMIAPGTSGNVLMSDGSTWASSAPASAPFSDATAIVKNASDATKLIALDASGVTTGTTITLKGRAATGLGIGTAATADAGGDNLFAATATTQTPLVLTVKATPTADWFRVQSSAGSAGAGLRVHSDGGVIINQQTGATFSSMLDVQYQGASLFSVNTSQAIVAGTLIASALNGAGGNWLVAASTGNETTNGTYVQTSANASAFISGANGATNPGLRVDNSTASAATGLQIKPAAAGSGIALNALSSGSNEDIKLVPKGTAATNMAGGGVQLAINATAKTANYTTTRSDYTILATTAGGAFTITLSSANASAGQVYQIKCTATSANALTLSPSSGSIDGAASLTVSPTTIKEAVVVQFDGTNWWVIGTYSGVL